MLFCMESNQSARHPWVQSQNSGIIGSHTNESFIPINLEGSQLDIFFNITYSVVIRVKSILKNKLRIINIELFQLYEYII